MNDIILNTDTRKGLQALKRSAELCHSHTLRVVFRTARPSSGGFSALAPLVGCGHTKQRCFMGDLIRMLTSPNILKAGILPRYFQSIFVNDFF
jgi:hypothetical protein